DFHVTGVQTCALPIYLLVRGRRVGSEISHRRTEVMNLGSAVAYLGSNSAATDKEILTTIESISTVGHQAGLSSDAIIGLGSAMEIGRASCRVPEIEEE